MKTYRYGNIFTYGSLQSVGHSMEYFARYTRKLVIFVVMPRVQGTDNMVLVYEKGKLKDKKTVPSSTNIVLYYAFWWWNQMKLVFSNFGPSEHFVLLAGHPIAFIGMSVTRVFRRVTYAYWIGDYFPPVHWSLIAFEWLKKQYHNRIGITYYLSDRINIILNGSCINTETRRTVLWGVQPPREIHDTVGSNLRLLFVGVIKQSQGIDTLLSYIHEHPHVSLSIVGVCDNSLYQSYTRIIDTLGISERVWFPNSFLNDQSLRRLSKKHHIGVAMYETGKDTATYYTDPGKIKTYIEMGLPVIMTDTSSITEYIRRFNAGVVVRKATDLAKAVDRIHAHYRTYRTGVHLFAQHFEYTKYYHAAFRALEHI